MNLADLFAFDVSPLELVLRGSMMYWFLFLVFRFVMRRDVGAVGTADVLLIVLVADASQNAMAGSSSTVAEGVVLVSTLLGWTWLLDFGSYYLPAVARLTDPPPVVMVRHGRVLHRNLRREHFTLDELHSELRKSGIASLKQVRLAQLENDGKLSVLRLGDEGSPTQEQHDRPPGA